ncbi:protein Star [Megalopta genalis]|uniref:protein Star n=1 Tax=Megalopta genalis TaxID=115081 RepID=UPI00144301E0|nr:protein Star-like [Megalopta genalis]XP_033328618.1 protein Star-like [Megalopta genalis]XP_033328619.1 protein Star-like [Megalopta genalis]
MPHSTEPTFPPGELFWTGMEPVKAKMAPAGMPPVTGVLQPPAGSTLAGSTMSSHKKSWWRKVAPCLAFLAAFSTAMALLLVWSEAAALRRQAFDANMTRDYVLNSVSMDNPELVAYIREVQLKPTTQQDPLNATQTTEEKYVSGLTEGKREGVYVEYISRIGAVSGTGWLERNLSWRGVLVLTDPRSFFEAHRSTRNPKTRVLHACLSTDKDTKEITYHQESEVQVTKLGEGPNSLVSSDEGLPTTRLKCFPLYSVLLAYSATTLDYLSLDSPDAQDGQVLDTIPWETTRISVLSIRWSSQHSEMETKTLIDKMTSRRYKLMYTTDNGKLIFMYNALLKI